MKLTRKEQPVAAVVAENSKGRTLTVRPTEPNGTKLRFTIESSKESANPVNTIAIDFDEARAMVAALTEYFGL